MYCLNCKKKTETSDTTYVKTKNNRQMMKGICVVCGCKKSMFIGSTTVKGGDIDIHSLIGKLPKPKNGWTLPKHKYTGPWNPLHKQLDENDKPLPGQEPYNKVDEIAMRHDICYRDHEDDKHGCDRQMIEELNDMKPTGLRERFDRAFVKGIIGTKVKLGLGNKKSDGPFEQLAEELHKPVKRKFPRRQVLV